MITEAFINIAYYIISLIIAIFPQSTGFPSQVTTAFTYIGGYLGILDPLVPISTLVQTVSIVIGVQLLILTFRMVQWAYSKLPFIGK